MYTATTNNNADRCIGGRRRGIANTTWPVRWILIVYFFSSAAMTPELFFLTDFVGEDVYGGNPDSSLSADVRGTDRAAKVVCVVILPVLPR